MSAAGHAPDVALARNDAPPPSGKIPAPSPFALASAAPDAQPRRAALWSPATSVVRQAARADRQRVWRTRAAPARAGP